MSAERGAVTKGSMEHNCKGNCWDVSFICPECPDDESCDVCHEHDEPRGSCSVCPKCDMCERIDAMITEGEK